MSATASAYALFHNATDSAAEDTALSALHFAGLSDTEPTTEDRRWWAEQSDEYEAWLDDCYAARTGLDDFDMCPGGIG